MTNRPVRFALEEAAAGTGTGKAGAAAAAIG